MSSNVYGLFPFRDKLLEAISRLKDAGFSDMEVMTPIPDHEIVDAVTRKPSKVGWITLILGLTGFVLGLLGPAWAHSHWGFFIGGKPVISIPPYVIIMFELTILLGAVSTFIGVLFLCKIPTFKLTMDEHYDPRVSEDHYMLVVSAEEHQRTIAESILREQGAEVK